MSANISWNSPDIVRDGLVLYLDAGTSNSYNRYSSAGVWKDMSGNGNSGSLINSPTFDSANGGSVVFDGVDDYSIISNFNNIVFGNGDFTVNIWMKFPISSTGEGGAWGPIISKGCNTTAPAGTWWVAQTSTNTNRVTLNISSTAGGTFVTSLNSATFNNGWNNVCVNRSGITSSIYNNGILGNIDTTSESDLSSTRPLTICSSFTTSITTQRTSTSISQVSIYNRALSSAEVLQNYNATKDRFGL